MPRGKAATEVAGAEDAPGEADSPARSELKTDNREPSVSFRLPVEARQIIDATAALAPREDGHSYRCDVLRPMAEALTGDGRLERIAALSSVQGGLRARIAAVIDAGLAAFAANTDKDRR
jgi:hypothetical protein